MAVDALPRASWSIGDAASARDQGGRVWVISGHDGENVIRAEGATVVEAWRNALAQAKALGMLRSS